MITKLQLTGDSALNGPMIDNWRKENGIEVVALAQYVISPINFEPVLLLQLVITPEQLTLFKLRWE